MARSLERTLGADFADLERALMAAAAEFSSDAQPLGELLSQMLADVERAARERLEIFPVAHHSPASAIHMVKRLRRGLPRVIFMEMCEDLHAAVAGLSDSTLPVALQAFAGSSTAFPAEWAPLSVIAPLTGLSAEYQAIAAASQHPEVALVFVDRSVDHVYQQLQKNEQDLQDALPAPVEDEDEDESAGLHGSSVGVELGRVMPTFGEFLDFLLANARVNDFAEWWSLYVEEPTLGASYETYRRVMFLIGSLIRRLGSTERALESDRMRERYMWTRMKSYLKEHGIAPEDAIYICGAAHTASDVPEFGVDSDALWEIPPRTDTEWLYGLIPSSFSAIEHQFSHPRGTISLAFETWKKALDALSLSPFRLARADKDEAKATVKKRKGTNKTAAKSKAAAAEPEEAADGAGSLFDMLTRPPTLVERDREQLLGWCTGIVGLARKNGYLASTADSIAIYHNALLLANLRSRSQPSPGDFRDAAVTCLEKASVPGKRSITRLCEMLLGADKIGQVGYSSLPPLVKDVIDRLKPAGVVAKKTTITRWLVDLRKQPELRPCSDLLWRLHYLLPHSGVARPIMGERKLGAESTQESWDIKTGGTEQRHLIELAYQGVTVEQVLENQLRARAMGPSATTVGALETAKASILLCDSKRLTEDIGERAVHLLTGSVSVADSQEISDRTRELVHYYRATPDGLPHWLRDLVAAGYQHYATMLPEAFADRGTSPEDVAGMLSFIFGFEHLAVTLGCERSQLVIAIEQAGAGVDMPDKRGLYWAAEWAVALKDEDAVRAEFDAILDNPMSRAGYPTYLSGFLLALRFKAIFARLGVELLSKAFCELPDSVLMPWLPGLIDSLRARAGDTMPALLKEAKLMLPGDLRGIDAWEPPWTRPVHRDDLSADVGAAASALPAPELSAEEAGARALLFAHRQSAEFFAASHGLTNEWQETAPAKPAGGQAASSADAVPAENLEERAARSLLEEHGEALHAFAGMLTRA